jgi:hypothetical protein
MKLLFSVQWHGAILAVVSGFVGMADAAPIGERPAPTQSAITERPGHDFMQTLNALVAAQIAAQNRPDQSNPYRVPRPRPDREQLLNPGKARG